MFDIARQGECPYIVSELLDGETLRDRLRGGALPVRKAIDYALQIARGLAAAQFRGSIPTTFLFRCHLMVAPCWWRALQIMSR